ncbi:hypothetical protein DPSP01_007635 [Paraphaeosphaeria sporulosa]
MLAIPPCQTFISSRPSLIPVTPLALPLAAVVQRVGFWARTSATASSTMAATSTSKRKNDAIEKEQSQHIEEVAVPKTHGSYTHVDETIARKVAANVDDFMVHTITIALVNILLPFCIDTRRRSRCCKSARTWNASYNGL